MKKLKKVIIVRHGHYNFDSTSKELSEIGIEQTNSLVDRIKRKISAIGKAQIFTSNLPRSIHTGKVVSLSLGIDNIKNLFDLELDKYHSRMDVYPVVAKRIQDDTEIVIIVTHFEMPSGLSDCFLREKFGVEVRPDISANSSGFLCFMETGGFCKI